MRKTELSILLIVVLVAASSLRKKKFWYSMLIGARISIFASASSISSSFLIALACLLSPAVRIGAMRKTELLTLLIVVLVAASSLEDMVIQVAAGPGGVDRCRPSIACTGRCFVKGACNKCCKSRGYPNGRCDGLGCYCCEA
ncbi:hypothetical protein EJB05_25418 [Eragrostis curvula]|uniref:Knottin scorpion toxin-like domain-containing protein n=1 Tax=Eragrostis curvula TaxID=38414 RepID=A0A5J9VBY7_9POAL|nr:hypothetical protein EJB05_25418 [Eragrostis curvula]